MSSSVTASRELRIRLARLTSPVFRWNSPTSRPRKKLWAKERTAWSAKAAEKRAWYNAILAGGGAEGLANVATFEALEELREALKAVEDPSDKVRVSSVIGRLTKVVLAESELRHQHALEAKAAALKTELANKPQATDPAAVAEALDRILGVKA